MLQYNVEFDLKTRMLANSRIQTAPAEKFGVSFSNVNRIRNRRDQIVNRTFVGMYSGRVWNNQ